MPSRPSLTSSFPITDSLNEVVCPLMNQDGSVCRKKCFGDKMYRSMQEHIRRAHPEYHIPKLPATKESFDMMINTGPSATRAPEEQNSSSSAQAYQDRHSYHRDDSNRPSTPKQKDDRALGRAHAAAVLAELGNTSYTYEAGDASGSFYHDYETSGRSAKSSIELPPLQNLSTESIGNDPYQSSGTNRPRDPLPSLYDNSPPERSATLPPIHRTLGPNRPRKHSVTKRGRDSYHQKKTSRDFVKRGGVDDLFARLRAQDRKAQSAEPPSDGPGSPWYHLLQVASEAGDLEDRTPIPRSPVSQLGSQPPSSSHAPLGQPFSYQASPLQQQALTPPSYNQDGMEPFPPLDSGDSGDRMRTGSQERSDASLSYSSQNPQIYCAGCRNVSMLKQSYACTECISGLCPDCVAVLTDVQGAKRKCPHCFTVGGQFKPILLDIR